MRQIKEEKKKIKKKAAQVPLTNFIRFPEKFMPMGGVFGSLARPKCQLAHVISLIQFGDKRVDEDLPKKNAKTHQSLHFV